MSDELQKEILELRAELKRLREIILDYTFELYNRQMDSTPASERFYCDSVQIGKPIVGQVYGDLQ